MSTLIFEWPIAECPTANHRDHWAVVARKTKSLRQYTSWLAEESDKHQRAQLTVEIGWPDKRRRDAHNLMPTLKACIDGFVDAGVLPDDSDAHLVGPDLRPYVAGKRGLVHLTFTFEEIPA